MLPLKKKNEILIKSILTSFCCTICVFRRRSCIVVCHRLIFRFIGNKTVVNHENTGSSVLLEEMEKKKKKKALPYFVQQPGEIIEILPEDKTNCNKLRSNKHRPRSSVRSNLLSTFLSPDRIF